MAANSLNRTRIGAGLLIEGVAAAVGGIIITFSRDHSLPVGAMAISISLLVFAIGRVVATTGLGRGRTTVISHVVGVLSDAAAAAVLLWFWLSPAPVAAWVYVSVVGAWAGLTAVTAIVTGWVLADRTLARDYIIFGALSGLFAIVEVALPLSDIYAVGIAGAYFVVVAVHLIIASVSVFVSQRQPARSVPTKEKK